MPSAFGQIGVQVRLGDADCPANTGGEQLAGLDQSTDDFGAEAEMLGDVRIDSSLGRRLGIYSLYYRFLESHVRPA